jgi:hypothetical protein
MPLIQGARSAIAARSKVPIKQKARPAKPGFLLMPRRRTINRFQIAESMGFKGDFRQWEDLLRIGE